MSSKVARKINAFHTTGIYHPCRVSSAAPGLSVMVIYSVVLMCYYVYIYR